HDREHGDEAGDVEDALHPRLHGVAHTDHEPLTGLQRAAPGVEQRSQHRRVHEGGPGQVDHDAAAAADRLVQALAQCGSCIDVVLSLHYDDDHVPSGVVEHDRI